MVFFWIDLHLAGNSPLRIYSAHKEEKIQLKLGHLKEMLKSLPQYKLKSVLYFKFCTE